METFKSQKQIENENLEKINEYESFKKAHKFLMQNNDTYKTLTRVGDKELCKSLDIKLGSIGSVLLSLVEKLNNE